MDVKEYAASRADEIHRDAELIADAIENGESVFGDEKSVDGYFTNFIRDRSAARLIVERGDDSYAAIEWISPRGTANVVVIARSGAEYMTEYRRFSAKTSHILHDYFSGDVS